MDKCISVSHVQVLIMSPWNYPVSLVIAPIVAAVAAGNAIVVKPSELSVHVSAELARLSAKFLDNDAIKFILVSFRYSRLLIP